MSHNAFLKVLVLFILFPAGLLSAPELDIRGDRTVNRWSRYATVAILLPKTRYEPGEKIPVRFRIENSGYEEFRIYPAMEIQKTYQFEVIDKRGRELRPVMDPEALKHREQGSRETISLTGDLVKEVILHPGETYEKEFYLNDFYELKPGGRYDVAGYFYPDSRYDFFVKSQNTIRVNVDNNVDRYRKKLRVESPLTSISDGVTPEEVVYLFLSAEMRKNWKNYLKYLDLEKYISGYDRYASRFALSSAEEKPVVLNEFVGYLTSGPMEDLKKFRIIRSRPERDNHGSILENGRFFVTARALRKSRGYSVRYEYIYTLEPHRDLYWKIVHVEARVLE